MIVIIKEQKRSNKPASCDPAPAQILSKRGASAGQKPSKQGASPLLFWASAPEGFEKVPPKPIKATAADKTEDDAANVI